MNQLTTEQISLINSIDIHALEKKIRKNTFDNKPYFIGNVVVNNKLAKDIRYYCYQNFDMLNIIKENNRLYARKQRIRNRIKHIFKLDASKYFLTITFNDYYLNDDVLDIKTRRKYVQRYLNNRCIDYVANIDFGKAQGREHYHAVICSNFDIDIFNQWKYGFIYLEEIKVYNVFALTKYLDKMTNHAIKVINYPIFCRHKKNNVL